MVKVYLVALFFSLLLSVAGQLLLKKGMTLVGMVSLSKGNPLKTVFRMLVNPFVIVGGVVFIASLAMWLVVLSKLDISYAYPIVGVNYVFVALSSRFFFKEKISWFRWLSIAIICFGVVLVSLS